MIPRTAGHIKQAKNAFGSPVNTLNNERYSVTEMAIQVFTRGAVQEKPRLSKQVSHGIR